TKLSLL
ncbi:transketolase, partial [Vibrio parahaemolyticus 970107]